MAIRVGLPQGLLFYQYGEVWAEFLRQLGVQVVLSGQTSRRTLDLGGMLEEVCLPVKVYFGHICELYTQVDYLFVPRVVSEAKGRYNCPEMIGIPDVIRSNLPHLPPLLDVVVSSKERRQMWRAVVEAGRLLGAGMIPSLMAWQRACFRHQSGQSLMTKKINPLTKQMGPFQRSPSVALIGHSYIIYDPQISMNVIDKLERQGLNVITSRMVSARSAARAAGVFGKEIFWTYSRHMAGAAIFLMQEPHPVDGVVFMTSFACGPDALIGELIQAYARSRRIPCMILSVDEHTAEAGLDTRVEAFADMLIMRWRP